MQYGIHEGRKIYFETICCNGNNIITWCIFLKEENGI